MNAKKLAKLDEDLYIQAEQNSEAWMLWSDNKQINK
jgi:hypothetical protein